MDGMEGMVLGEALKTMGRMPDDCVDAVITDPPYSSGGLHIGARRQDPLNKYAISEGKNYLTFSGDQKDQRSYYRWSVEWMTEALRVAKPGAALAVFSDWRQLPVLTDAVQAAGWTWRGVGVWDKTRGGCRPNRGGMGHQAEYIVWGAKGRLIGSGVFLPGVFQARLDHKAKRHPTQKPLEVMRELVTLAPVGGVVLDPFAGAGTTGVACALEGRGFIGVELSPDFYAIAVERIQEARMKKPA